jgi:hypothetical protein
LKQLGADGSKEKHWGGSNAMKTRLRSIGVVAAVAVVLCAGGCSDCDVKITTDSLPDGVVGVDYRFQFDSDCGGDFWDIEFGSLPPGIELQDDGDLRGAPTVAGSFVFTVSVFDFDGHESSKGFSLTVVEAP